MQQRKMDNREGQILGERRIELGLTQEYVAFLTYPKKAC